MKCLILFLALFGLSTAASAFEVSEEMLNKFVEQKLAEKNNRDIQLLNPKVTLLDGFASICSTVHTKVLANDVDFCAHMTPKWRQETGSLLATRMSLVSLNAPGVSGKNIEMLKMMVNQLVLPGLEGIEVYRAENFIGRQISSVKVMPGKLDLSYW